HFDDRFALGMANPHGHGRVATAATGKRQADFVLSGLRQLGSKRDRFLALARALVVDVTLANKIGAIPRLGPLADLLGVGIVDHHAVAVALQLRQPGFSTLEFLLGLGDLTLEDRKSTRLN